MRKDQHVYILEEMSITHKEYMPADVTLSWITAMEWECSGGTILINDLAYPSRQWRTIKLYPRLTSNEVDAAMKKMNESVDKLVKFLRHHR